MATSEKYTVESLREKSRRPDCAASGESKTTALFQGRSNAEFASLFPGKHRGGCDVHAVARCRQCSSMRPISKWRATAELLAPAATRLRLAYLPPKYRTLLSEAGTPLEVQQKLLRHADIRTTTLYGGVPWRTNARPTAQPSGRFLSGNRRGNTLKSEPGAFG
jgi:integrase